MDGKQVKRDGNACADSERRRELSEMLRDLVEKETRAGTARLLGVDRKTVARALDSGIITDHMAGALERLVGGGEEEGARISGENGSEEHILQLEENVAEMWETLESLGSPVEGEGTDGEGEKAVVGVEYESLAPETGANETREEEGLTRGSVPSVEGLNPSPRRKLRREDPELVTEQPAEDDPEVYGAAWPLVEEWRRLREGHPFQGKSLSWLLTREKLLVLELGMLEEHGLTLPPETQPLRGFGRRGQTRWRHRALHDTREAIRKRKMLRWVRRVLTLGIWWK